MSNKIVPNTIEEARNMMAAAIAELEACVTGPTGEDLVLCWTNGLGVKMFPGGQSGAVGIARAQAFDPNGPAPVVTNGHKQTAMPMLRKEAAAAYLPTLRESMAELFG